MSPPSFLHSLRLHSVLTLAIYALFASRSAQAANSTWLNTGATDGNWSTASNWVGSVVPGSTSLTTSADVATFSSAVGTFGTTGNPIIINSATQNLGGITFSGASGNYFIGTTAGNALNLTNGGTISMTGLSGTNVIGTINAPLSIQAAGGSYTVSNNSNNGTGSGAGTLNLGGAISGAVAGTTTLTLSGSNTNLNTVSGAISNGTATNLALIKTGAGVWSLTGANSHTGATTVNQGTLNLTGAGTLDGTSGVTVSGATLVVGDTVATTNKINPAAVLNLGGTFTLTKPTTGVSTQTFSSLTLSPGVSTINNTNGAAALSFTGATGGAYVRNAGGFFSFTAATANFTNAPTAAGGSSVTNSGTPTNDILIGASFGTTDFVSAAAGTIAATTAYTANTMGTGVNTNITTSSTLSGDTQSLRFGTTGGQTLTLSGLSTIESGGILQAVSGTSVITGGSIQAASGKNLWIYGNTGNNLNISSIIADNGTSGFEKYGTNTVNLSGANTFAGQIWLSGGFLGMNSTSALGAGTAAINFVGGTTLQANTSGISIARNIVVYTGQTATIATNGNDVTLSGSISNNVATTGTSNFTKTGLGKLTLSGNSTFTSPVALSLTGGEIEITGSYNTQGNLGNASSTAGITFTVSGSGVMSNTAVGGGTGDWNFGNTNGVAGTPTAITLNLKDNAQMTVGSRLFIGKADYIVAIGNQSGNSTLTTGILALNSDVKTGTSNIYNLNGGTLNTSTGVQLGAGGVLNLNGGTSRATGNGSLFAASGTSIGSVVVKTGGAIFNTNGFTTTVTPALPLTHDAALGATADGGVTKNGAGTLVLGGVSTYTGTTTVNAGTLTAGSAASSSATITTANNSSAVTTATTAGLAIGQAVSGPGIPANTYITAINVNGTQFTISANATTALGAGTGTGTFAATQGLGGGAVVLANTAGAILNLSGSTPVAIASLSGGGASGGNVTLGAATLNTGSGNTSTSYSGILSGTGGLTKTGTGTQTLTGANTYTGATNINGGTLAVNGSLAAGSAVTVGASGSLGGSGTVNGTVNASGTIAPGNSAGTLTTGAATLTGTLAVEIDGATGDKLHSNGALNISGAQLTVSLLAGGFTQPSYVIAEGSSLTGTFASVPAGYSVTYSATQATLTQTSGNYASWATANGIPGQPASGDFDHDGISNLVEYALGTNPTVSTQPAGTFASGVVTFTKGSDAIANNDVIFEIEKSTDLGMSDPWTTVVTEGTADDTPTISYVLPTGLPKVFVRLKVTQVVP